MEELVLKRDMIKEIAEMAASAEGELLIRAEMISVSEETAGAAAGAAYGTQSGNHAFGTASGNHASGAGSTLENAAAEDNSALGKEESR